MEPPLLAVIFGRAGSNCGGDSVLPLMKHRHLKGKYRLVALPRINCDFDGIGALKGVLAKKILAKAILEVETKKHVTCFFDSSYEYCQTDDIATFYHT